LSQELAQTRTLVEHRFYVVLPSDQGSATRARALTSLLPSKRRTQAQEQHQRETLEQAAHELDLRVDLVTQRLTRLGLHCRRLEGEELVHLYDSCLTPTRALHTPLASEVLRSVGRPIKVTGSLPFAAPSAFCHTALSALREREPSVTRGISAPTAWHGTRR